jgi:DNA polymerase-3 subunit delta'
MNATREKARVEEAQSDLAPSDWTSLRGHESLLERACAMEVSGRMPPVVLVEGREGIGKSLVAARLAALPFCERENACGECLTCRSVARRVHPEILWVEAEGAVLKLEQVAAIQEHLVLAPSTLTETVVTGGLSRRARVAVIPDVERLSPAAANRLLKLLEEPPVWARVIMTTSRPASMLPTVLSRCARWLARPPSMDACLEVMRRWAREGVEDRFDEELARRALKASGCSLGGAERLYQDWRSGGQGGLRAVAQSLLEVSRVSEVLGIASDLRNDRSLDGQSRRKVFALAQELEIILNEKYREALLADPPRREISPQALHEIRQLLREARRLAGRGQIELNVQLFAEAIGMRALDARIG